MHKQKFLKNFLLALSTVGSLNFLPAMINLDAVNLSIISVACAEFQTFTASDTAMADFGEENIDTVKNVAKMRAEEKAKERIEIYVGNFAKSLGGILTADDISTIADNISKVIGIPKYQKLFFQAKDEHGNLYGKVGYMYESTVTLQVDSDGISEYINRNAKEKATLIEQNKIRQKTLDDIDKDFEDLRKNSSDKTPEQIKSELEKIDNRILVARKVGEENRYSYQKNVTLNKIKNENDPFRKIIGTYIGSYLATQGETGLTLTIYEENGTLKAIFDFYNLKNKNNSKSGKYYMNVSYNKDSGSYEFIGYEWIMRPSPYIFADLKGKLNGDILSGDTLGNGRIVGSFSVSRIK